MAQSFFFYDLETSGFNPRQARIMQFAGQRTDANLNPVGHPVNYLIKLTPDILPDPGAVMVTGITPQQTIAEGLTEAEFLKIFYDVVVRPDTIFCGFNSVRFDDEFMRFLMYRNFYDAYEWEWKNGCSRWDILDVVRMTRAIKPEGIKWPFASDGKPANKLELLTSVNKLSHDSAHDALSDVRATIAVARLVKTKQPELFDFLLNHRGKDAVAKVVESGGPFMYTSGRYPSENLHTSPVTLLGKQADQANALVFDLRYDPRDFAEMTVEELIEAWKFQSDPDIQRLPVKTLKYNRTPAVIPGVVNDEATLNRLHIDRNEVARNLRYLGGVRQKLSKKLLEARTKMDAVREQQQTQILDNSLTVDERLYDGFIDNRDKSLMSACRAADPDEISDFAESFVDSRLKNLVPLYKARNYPNKLDTRESAAWDDYRSKKLLAGGGDSQVAIYVKKLEELAGSKTSDQQRYVLEELKLYLESIVPSDAV